MITKRFLPYAAVLALATWVWGCDSGSPSKADQPRVDQHAPSKSVRGKGRKERKERKRHKRRKRDTQTHRRETSPSSGLKTVVENVTVKNFRKVVYRGAVDLGPTIDRIKRGESYPHRNDGRVFGNREGRLPRQSRGYYREYVHPTDGVRGPGPQRIIVGQGGEWYYTADHYRSFIRLDK